MGWKENKEEHAKLWNSGVGKILQSLDKRDFQIADSLFAYDNKWLQGTALTERQSSQLFLSWLLSCFCKENTPLVKWYIKKHGSNLSQDEREILLAGSQSRFDVFKVEAHNDENLKVEDAYGKIFLVDVIDLKKLEPGTVFVGRIHSKGNGRYFIPGVIAPNGNSDAFRKLRKVRQFHASWSAFLTGFFKHQVSAGLTKRTADKHTENVDLLLMFLEHETQVDSFEQITKQLLRMPFKKFVKKHIVNRVDLDKVYYSLYKFFVYLSEKKGIKNEKVLEWLKQR